VRVKVSDGSTNYRFFFVGHGFVQDHLEPTAIRLDYLLAEQLASLDTCVEEYLKLLRQPDAALYLVSPVKCEQIGTGDSPSSLGSPRPLVSRGVVRHHRSSTARTVDRGRKPASGKAGSRRAEPHREER
jgi:hypothetical protein